jgi:hypothetical protein
MGTSRQTSGWPVGPPVVMKASAKAFPHLSQGDCGASDEFGSVGRVSSSASSCERRTMGFTGAFGEGGTRPSSLSKRPMKLVGILRELPPLHAITFRSSSHSGSWPRHYSRLIGKQASLRDAKAVFGHRAWRRLGAARIGISEELALQERCRRGAPASALREPRGTHLLDPLTGVAPSKTTEQPASSVLVVLANVMKLGNFCPIALSSTCNFGEPR